MRRRSRARNTIALSLIALLLAAAGRPAAAQVPAACTPARTAVVLAGGAARGFAHIGVLRVLDSLRIRPDLIVGSSVGAVMGGLYASGYNAHEIDSIMRVLPLTDIVHAYDPRSPGVLSSVPALTIWENKGRGFYLHTSTVQESEANASLNAIMLRGNLIARGDFDRLPIPFRAVASDITTRKRVVLDSGDLARAVRASAAIPLIFAPVEIGGRLLFDGGLADNTPIDVARELRAERVILSWVPRARVDPSRLDDPREVAEAMGQLLVADDTSALREPDILVRSRTDDYSTLDFSPERRDSLIHEGAVAARAAFMGRCLSPLGTRNPADVPTRVNAVVIGGENTVEGSALRAALRLRPASRLHEDSLRLRLLRLGRADAYQAVWLQPTRADRGGDSTVDFDVRYLRAARHVLVAGLAYDNDYGGRIWGGFADRRLFGLSLEAGVLLDVNKYRSEVRATVVQQLALIGRVFPLYGSIAGTGEDVRQFQDSVELAASPTSELAVSAGVRPRLGRLWSLELGAEYRVWSEPGRRNAPSVVGVRFMASRIGSDRRPRIAVEGMANREYQLARTELAVPFELYGFTIAPRVRAAWGDDVPLQHTFSFGGADGFAGLINGSRRGTQEALGALAVSHALFGPIRLRAEIMTGATGSGRGFLRRHDDPLRPYDGEIITGLRTGVEMRTAVGDVRIEYGLNSNKQNAAFVRVGKWF